jgi:hypothetical protein
MATDARHQERIERTYESIISWGLASTALGAAYESLFASGARGPLLAATASGADLA